MTLRARAYRLLMQALLSQKKRPLHIPEDVIFTQESLKKKRLWFHAASVGELEALLPLIEVWKSKAICWVTLFSQSGLAFIQRPEVGLFKSLSPLEGHWQEAIRIFHPDLCVTYRYEAWPEWWLALAEDHLPLLIVAAKHRASFQGIAFLLKALGCPPPPLMLGLQDPQERARLAALFPKASFRVCGDPRWDRVIQRKEQQRQLPAFLGQRTLPRPLLILGSIWLADLDFLEPSLKVWPGALWVVPHATNPPAVKQIEARLNALGWSCERFSTPSFKGHHQKALLVDQGGWLADLYRFGQAAYIGGGWGKGMHNVMEPAVYGLPVATGPARAGDFPEVAFLKAQGQLTLLTSPTERNQWFEKIIHQPSFFSLENNLSWKTGEAGATQRLTEWLEAFFETQRAL